MFQLIGLFLIIFAVKMVIAPNSAVVTSIYNAVASVAGQPVTRPAFAAVTA